MIVYGCDEVIPTENCGGSSEVYVLDGIVVIIIVSIFFCVLNKEYVTKLFGMNHSVLMSCAIRY